MVVDNPQLAFVKRLEQVSEDYSGDTEAIHAYMDDVLIETLEGLGYCCLLFKETEMWYA